LQYVLDVWEHEPDLDPLLLRDALLATPHIAGYSAQGKANATALSVRTIGRYFGLSLGEWYPSNIAPSRPRATVRSTGRTSGRTGPLHWPCPGRNNRRYEGWRAMRPAAVAGRDRARVPRRRGRIANRFRGAPAHRLPRRAKC
jgi:hypothetical protein